jgi:hypothetical protein
LAGNVAQHELLSTGVDMAKARRRGARRAQRAVGARTLRRPGHLGANAHIERASAPHAPARVDATAARRAGDVR